MDMAKLNPSHPGSFKTRAVFAAVVVLGILSAGIYWINFKIYERFPIFADLKQIEFYVIVFMVLSALYLVAVFLAIKMRPGNKNTWRMTGIIIFLAIIFRLCLIAPQPAVLSSDIYRYIWDGRVQQNGINPYLYPPAAAELENLRDDRIFPHINRKDDPTLYPAGAQVFFRIFYMLVGDSVTGYKSIMVFFDLLTLAVLIALLQTCRLNRARIIVYAWNPLVVFEIAYSGHLEGLVVFLMVAALYLYLMCKKIPAIIMLAVSAAVKLYPALLLAAFLNRADRVKGIIAFAATLILLYLPFVAAGGKITGFLPVYLKNPYESFNLGLKTFVMRLVPSLDYAWLSLLFLVVLATAGLIVFLKEKKDFDVLRYAYILTGLLLILMPAALHPWYVVLITPFLVIYPCPAWLLFSCSVTLSYLKYTSPQGMMPDWVLWAEYLPLFVSLSAGFILSKYSRREKVISLDLTEKNKKIAGVP
jgi:alpha-1,6-mannosyltransferase